MGKKKVTAKPTKTDVAKGSSEDALPEAKAPEGTLCHIDLDCLAFVESVARGEDEGIERLCESLRRHGQLVPAIVRDLGNNKYLVEDGTRRLLALKRLQEKHGEKRPLLALVRCKNTTAPAGQLSFESLVANLDRKEFSLLRQGEARGPPPRDSGVVHRTARSAAEDRGAHGRQGINAVGLACRD